MSAKPRFDPDALREILDELVLRYDDAQYRRSDPVLFAHRYSDPADREIAALLAAGLAYGRVASILHSVEEVLRRLGPRPAEFVDGASRAELNSLYQGFRHRWTSGAEVAGLLEGVRGMRQRSAGLGAAFAEGMEPEATTVRPALIRWVELLRGDAVGKNSLLPDPARPSACKRLYLYLRWMVRHDRVDPGGWTGVPASKLVVPIDVHMHRVGQALGFTRRKQADYATALEITEGFRSICPEDPVRYDFALTRPGILAGVDPRGSAGLRELRDALGNVPIAKSAPPRANA